MRKRILVTGGAGFMGSDFIRFLKHDRYIDEIVNLDSLTYAANLQALEEIEGDSRYTFVKGNICDAHLIDRLFEKYQFDAVVHFAGETHVDKSIEAPKEFIQTNIVGTYVLLETLRRYPQTRFHLISSDEVYGELPQEGVFTEKSLYAPSSPYAATKAASDHLAMSYVRTYGCDITLSHASNNYGPYQHQEKLIPCVIERCKNQEPITVHGSGLQVRDWLHVRDHSKAVYQILSSGKKGEVYNIGGGNERRNIDVINHIIAIYAKLQKVDSQRLQDLIVYVKDRPGQDFRYAMDPTKMQKELSWRPEVDFEEGLKEVVEGMVRTLQKARE